MTISKLTDATDVHEVQQKLNEVIQAVNDGGGGGGGSSLPSMTGHAGDVLSNDESDALWADTETVYPVIETWGTNAGWYRIYAADETGYQWCEQGGIVTRTALTAITINLYKTYSDYNYNVNVQNQAADNYTTNSYTYSPYVINKTTTGFQAVQSSPAITAIGYYVWETKGYLQSSSN